MISIEDLKEHGRLNNLNLGQSEKSLFQDIILFLLYQEYGQELIFKGGTALTKCYGLNRFSEDLDFTSNGNLKNIYDILDNGLNRFNIEHEIKKENNKQESFKIKILIKGPTYVNIRQSLCSLRIDISQREKIVKKPIIKTIKTFNLPIPSFDIIVMDLEEIFAEKIRAIITRNQARDVYDLFYILEYPSSIKLINEKLKFYNLSFSLKTFITNLNKKEKIWDSELNNLILNYPNFEVVKKEIIKTLKKLRH